MVWLLSALLGEVVQGMGLCPCVWCGRGWRHHPRLDYCLGGREGDGSATSAASPTLIALYLSRSVSGLDCSDDQLHRLAISWAFG